MESEKIFQTISFAYGAGEYKRGQSAYQGQIVLSAHKLYLRDAEGDIADTFIPLEKIYRVRQGFGGGVARFDVRPSPFMQFEAVIKGDSQNIRALIRHVVSRRHLTRKGWRREWIDPEIV